MGAVLPGAPGVPTRRRARGAGARPRAARHPAVHERLDERAEGRDDPRPGAHAPTSTPAARPASIVPEHEVMVSWLPLYHDMGLVGFLAIPMTRGVDLVQAAPQDFLAHPGNWMQWISDWRRHGHGRARTSRGCWPRGRCKRMQRPRPVVADAGAVGRRARRSRRGRGVRRRRRAVRVPAGRRVPGVRHGRGGDRRRVPAARPGPGVRHRRPRRARARPRRQAGRGRRSRRPGAGRPPAAAARPAGARAGDAGRRPRHVRGACPSATSASC